MVAAVDAATRINVLKPGAAHLGMTLQDSEGNPSLLQADTGQQTGHAGTNHDNLESGFCLDTQAFHSRRGIRVLAIQGKLGRQVLTIFRRDLLADHVAHHLLHQ